MGRSKTDAKVPSISRRIRAAAIHADLNVGCEQAGGEGVVREPCAPGEAYVEGATEPPSDCWCPYRRV